jgi:hypothetical protein
LIVSDIYLVSTDSIEIIYWNHKASTLVTRYGYAGARTMIPGTPKFFFYFNLYYDIYRYYLSSNRYTILYLGILMKHLILGHLSIVTALTDYQGQLFSGGDGNELFKWSVNNGTVERAYKKGFNIA